VYAQRNFARNNVFAYISTHGHPLDCVVAGAAGRGEDKAKVGESSGKDILAQQIAFVLLRCERDGAPGGGAAAAEGEEEGDAGCGGGGGGN
jgi:hypothetical protein